ncbi:uncharacterized protein LOC119637014 [Glossina fuscipes]|uniref:Uncharacterized protein LOC119637014 n=1 Tax=Glossina fuscipes TaxID=7396 RepID=A0A9C5YZ62_9MUSC|nr:uncharacterized protein LOC119637014 [Glossina fuscipes]KAI9582416.1 hypothetical protein GQX74_009804 [Glossina fuscipes]
MFYCRRYKLLHLTVVFYLVLFEVTAFNENLILQFKENIQYFKDFIASVREEREFQTLFMMQNFERFPYDSRIDFLVKLEKPKIILQKHQQVYIKSEINSEIFAVVLVLHEYDEKLFLNLAASIRYIRPIRVLVLAFFVKEQKKFQKSLLDFCELNKIINLLVNFIETNVESNLIYYQLTPFPWFKWSTHSFNFNKNGKNMFYASHWRNMQGKPLYTLPDQIEPRTMVFADRSGHQVISGYLGKLLLLFAEMYNATLKFPFEVNAGEVIHSLKVENYTHHGILDVGMSMDFTFRDAKWQGLSYPFELTNWGIMVPCSQLVHIADVFGLVLTWDLYLTLATLTMLLSIIQTIFQYVIKSRLLWIDIFLNDKILRGVLGQSFALSYTTQISLQLLYGVVFLIGLINSALYSAHLKTLITTPTYQSHIKTFDDLRNSKTKLLFDVGDKDTLNAILSPELEKKLEGCMIFTNDTGAYQRNRKMLNISYGYTVTQGIWNALQMQQKYFLRSVFCQPVTLNFLDFMLMALPLQENSPYKEPLDNLILSINAVGLLEAWSLQTFHDMVRQHKIPLIDTSEKLIHEPLKIEDLYWIWIILIGGLIISFFIFIAEKVFNAIQVGTKRLK